MKNIDFLPEIYRQKRHQRRAMRWWCVVACVFAGAILSAAVAQWAMRRGIQHELAQVEPKYLEALNREAELAAVRQEITRMEEVAGLYAYLAHPWPRTQLLAGIIKPLPDSIRLTEVTIAFEMLPQEPILGQASAPGGPDAGAKLTPSTAMEDLTQLKTECDGRQAVLSITGTTTVLTELHAYVDQLGRSPLIAAAHVKSVESAGPGPGPGAGGESRFHVHVVARAGYGQRGGPLLEPRSLQPRALVPSAAGGATQPRGQLSSDSRRHERVATGGRRP